MVHDEIINLYATDMKYIFVPHKHTNIKNLKNHI